MTEPTKFDEVFAVLWDLMCERWGVEKSASVAHFYRNALRERLDVDQLRIGGERVLYGSRYFPSPKEIVEAALGSAEDQALEDWELCQALMGGSDVLDRMSPAGRRVVGHLGGASKLRNTRVDQVSWVRKEFLAMYGDVHETVERGEWRALLDPTQESRKVMAGAVPNLLGDGGAYD